MVPKLQIQIHNLLFFIYFFAKKIMEVVYYLCYMKVNYTPNDPI